jgi:hypothetical protein
MALAMKCARPRFILRGQVTCHGHSPVDPVTLPGRRGARKSFWGAVVDPQGSTSAATFTEAKANAVSTPQMCLAPPRTDATFANPSDAEDPHGTSSIA